MALLNEKQKVKIIFETEFETVDVDCFIKSFSSKNITLSTFPNGKTGFEDLTEKTKVLVKVFTSKGLLIFDSCAQKIISDTSIVIENNESSVKPQNMRENPRYSASCPITIFRPLKGNIEAQLVDISIKGLRFFSTVSLEKNSKYEIMLNLSQSVGKIILTGKILDKEGLPEGIHRMVIEKISNSDRQKLVEYCMSLAQ